MRSDIKLYRDVELTPDRNFAVDDIEDYLSVTGNYNQITGNYFKHELNTSILLDLKQKELDYDVTHTGAYHYNYCAIYNYNNEVTPIAKDAPVYYFITNKKWRSKNIVELELYMDTVATFGWLKLTDRTLIHRQHIDRFKIISGNAVAVIDKVKESLNPILYKSNKYELIDNSIYTRMKWYIAYISKNAVDPSAYNQVNPLDVIVFPEEKILAHADDGDMWYDVNNTTPFTYNKQYLVSPFNNACESLIVTNNSTYECPIRYIEGKRAGDPVDTVAIVRYVIFEWTSSSVTIRYYESCIDEDDSILSTTNLSTNTGSQIRFKMASSKLYMLEADAISPISPFFTSNFSLKKDAVTIGGIDNLDLTDAKIIKVVEFPYCPLHTEVISTGVLFNHSFEFGSMPAIDTGAGMHGLKMPKDKYIVGYTAFGAEPYPEMANLKHNLGWFSGKLTASKDINNEPKLYNSEIYVKKFMYDSFYKEFKYEDAKINNLTSTTKFSVDMYVSLAITSKFMFQLSFPLQDEIEDYADKLVIARNNEIPIYTNQYLNYLRVGLQYDLKNKERQENASMTNLAITSGVALAGLGLSVASLNPLAITTAGVSAFTSITSGVTNAVNQGIANQQAIESKMGQLRQQATSVQGSDDLPLLDAYCENRAFITDYKPSDAMCDAIFKLFFYTGYKYERMGVPNLKTRKRFNYIQADIDIDLVAAANHVRNMPKECLDDYKARFAIGLTVFHAVGSSVYDFDQQYENWEVIFNNYLS